MIEDLFNGYEIKITKKAQRFVSRGLAKSFVNAATRSERFLGTVHKMTFWDNSKKISVLLRRKIKNEVSVWTIAMDGAWKKPYFRNKS